MKIDKAELAQKISKLKNVMPKKKNKYQTVDPSTFPVQNTEDEGGRVRHYERGASHINAVRILCDIGIRDKSADARRSADIGSGSVM